MKVYEVMKSRLKKKEAKCLKVLVPSSYRVVVDQCLLSALKGS